MISDRWLPIIGGSAIYLNDPQKLMWLDPCDLRFFFLFLILNICVCHLLFFYQYRDIITIIIINNVQKLIVLDHRMSSQVAQ